MAETNPQRQAASRAGCMILVDSNIIIYVTSGQYPELTSWFLDNAPSASAISKVEVLGYHNLKSTEKTELERFFSRLNVIYQRQKSLIGQLNYGNDMPCRLAMR